MEDDNELELSLGLYCGGSSSKSKGKVGNSSDSRIEDDKGKKPLDDFKNFFQPSIPNQDSNTGSQKTDQIKPQENFFNSLIPSPEIVEEKRSEVTNNKRKSMFDGTNQNKKLDYDQTRASHISITTEDGSTAENEDVSGSEVDGSTSKLALEAPKETRRVNIPSESEFKVGHMTYGVPYAGQKLNMINGSNPAGATGTSTYPLMPSTNGDRSMNSDLPLAFGYAPVQLPVLNKDQSWGIASYSQQPNPPFVGRGAQSIGNPNEGLKISQGLDSSSMQVLPPTTSEPVPYTERRSEPSKLDGKSHAREEGSSNHPDPIISPHEGPSIRPGAAADLKFDGCGSYPNLPWVSTTAPGPNGRTISGVTYRFNGNQIKIVCACHGTHMSPEEFIRHATEEHPNPDTSNLAGFPNGNPATSAQT